MTAAALIIRVCLSIDIPSFLCHGHELQTILRECTQVHSQRSQAEPLMQLAGILPLMWLSVYEDVPFQTVWPGNGVSCTRRGVCVCVCDLSGILINFVNEHRRAFCVCVLACDCDCFLLRRTRLQLDRDVPIKDTAVYKS